MTLIETPGAGELTAAQAELRERARRFVEDELIPREEMAERAGGVLPEAEVDAIARRRSPRASTAACTRSSTAARAGATSSGRSSRSSSGARRTASRGTSRTPTTCSPTARRSRSTAGCGPACAASRRTPTRSPRSTPARTRRGSRRPRTRTDAGWRIDGEKWFVTSGDVRAVYIVVANAIVDGEPLPTLFLVEPGAPGVEIVDDPPFTHTYPHGHPTVRFTGVEVPDDAVLGGVGAGDDLQRAWFTEERLGIAARGLGAMWRLLEESIAWATSREQGGARIYDHQGVSFPLADSAADAAAGRALDARGRALADAGRRPQARPRQGLDGQALRLRGARARAPTARCRRSAAAATCARTWPSGSCASCASTASGRGRARSSG